MSYAGEPRARGGGGAVVVGALLIAVAACSGDDGSTLSAKDFNSGVCRESAQSVIAVDTAVRELQDDEKKPGEVVGALKRSQTRLRAARAQADQALNAKISDLTNAIGVFRVGIDAGTAGAKQAQEVAAALQPVVDACTASS